MTGFESKLVRYDIVGADEEAADRLGHVDSGELLDRVYDQGDRGARAQRAIAAKAPRGLRATLAEETRPASTPAALPGADEATR